MFIKISYTITEKLRGQYLYKFNSGSSILYVCEAGRASVISVSNDSARHTFNAQPDPTDTNQGKIRVQD